MEVGRTSIAALWAIEGPPRKLDAVRHAILRAPLGARAHFSVHSHNTEWIV